LLERRVRGLPRDAHPDGDVLGERAGAPAEDLVAGLQVGDVGPHGLDRAREVAADERRPRLDDSHHRASGPRHAGHAVPVTAVHGARPHPYENRVVRQLGTLDLAELESFRRPVPLAHDRLHRPGISFRTAYAYTVR